MAGTGGFLVHLNDPWLKPRLLKALVAERLPQPGGAELPPAEVESVLHAVRTHGLLAESLPGHPPDSKLAEAWRAAVDAWVERLSALVEGNSFAVKIGAEFTIVPKNFRHHEGSFFRTMLSRE